MSVQRFLITVLLLIALVLPAGAPTALAQRPIPTTVEGGDWLPPRANAASNFSSADLPPSQTKDDPATGAIQTPDGLWMMPAETAQPAMRAKAVLQPNGGPDDFGYTFNATALNWIDASGGADTGISSSVDNTGPIAIGFPFKYYENTYSQLWVSRFGFLAFNSNNLYRSQSRIPEPQLAQRRDCASLDSILRLTQLYTLPTRRHGAQPMVRDGMGPTTELRKR